MRRALAAVLFLNLVLITGGAASLQRSASCCCAGKSGLSCPMRTHCAAADTSCSMHSTPGPTIEQRPLPYAVIASASVPGGAGIVRPFSARATLGHDSVRKAPDAPPPRPA